jgi:class 3 adenylate cyclase/tetratricopeptide (TPR) repeat protein
MDLGVWLRNLGLEEYEAAFRDNKIDERVLPSVTQEDLKEIGVGPVGHRRKLLDAIALLRGTSTATASPSDASPTVPKPPQDTAERRHVTVMFSDLVGSTALSARMDPEDLREIISAYQKCVAETVQRFGGFVAKYMGDGVLVYFGYPQAHEDDAERAVRAGLQLVAAVRDLKTTHASLQTRLGIATGLVVVGDVLGSGEAQERGIVGETPNLAARLRGIAEPNTVVIAESTRKLLGNLFELEDRGPQELKGIDGTVRASVALRPSSVESRFEALRIATTPMVGREEEVTLLLRRWEQAKAGEGQIVLVSGEPGIGKSRLAETMVGRLAGEPHIRLRFFCSPHHQDSALYPVIAHLERASDFRRDDTAEQRLDKLEALLAQATNDLGGVTPLLADLLAVPTGERYPPLNLTPQKRKEKTLTALTAQVEGLSVREPVLMVYEDVHWSDPTTRESLDLLIDRVPALRVLMIITFRPEFTPPWIGRPHVTMLTLNRLPRRHGAEIIAHVTGGKALPKEIADQIADRTDGIPLFIEELTKTVVESGIVREAGGHYAMTGPTAPLAIPTSLHASLLARLDSLAPTREVAQIGAALGRSFSYELISAVAGMPPQKLAEALEQLAKAELIFRRGAPPDAEYTFKHALVQDAAYSTLLRNRRQQLHAQIASTLEGQFPEIVATRPALIAQHCAEAGLDAKAVDYWLTAGQQAVARSSLAEADAQLRRGLNQVSRLPDGPARQERELELQLALAPVLVATRGYSASDVKETIERSQILAEQLARADLFVPLLYGLWGFHYIRGESKLALSAAEQMEALGQERSDDLALMLGHVYHAIICYCSAEFATSVTLLNKCHDLSKPSHREACAGLTAEDPYVMALSWLATALTTLGYVDQGRERIAEAISTAHRLKQPYSRGFALVFACAVAWVTRAASDEKQYADELIALSMEHNFFYLLSFGHFHRGFALTALGQPQEGLDAMAQALSMFQAIGAVCCTPWIFVVQADAYAKLDQPQDASNCLANAAQTIESTDERFVEPELHRIRGELLARAGDTVAAEHNYRLALAKARKQASKLYELRAAASLARLWLDQGKRDEARELLARVYGWFTEGFDTRDLKEAKALLEELVA